MSLSFYWMCKYLDIYSLSYVDIYLQSYLDIHSQCSESIDFKYHDVRKSIQIHLKTYC